MELHPVRPTVKTPAERFTGDVYMTPIHFGTEPSRMTVALVRFTPGARTNWHRHAVGQALHVTEGVGLVGTRDGDVLRIRAGDTVVCPPDEEHWHGATPDTFMSHLALTENLPGDEDPTTWLECPPDEEHWHGATPDTFMSHLALTENLPGDEDPTTWLEPLPDEQYQAADAQ